MPNPSKMKKTIAVPRRVKKKAGRLKTFEMKMRKLIENSDLDSPPDGDPECDDTDSDVWGDDAGIRFPSGQDVEAESEFSAQSDTDESSPNASDSEDTDAEAWNESSESPIEALCQHLMMEVREYSRMIRSDSHCALCPFRSFNRPSKVRGHLRLYHNKDNNWSASGRKQLRICVALHDYDMLST